MSNRGSYSNRGAVLALCAFAGASGCADVLGIHPLDDAGGGDDAPVLDGAATDAPGDAIDAPDVDAPDVDAPDAMTAIDAPVIDAAVIDAPVIDAPAIDAATDAAIDAPPIDAGTVPIGEYAMLGGSLSINGNFIIARRLSTSGDTVIVGAGAYLSNETVGGRIKFAVYSDNANAPYQRRTISADVTLDGNAGRNEISMGPHTLPFGTWWMVMAVDQSTGIGSLDSNNVTGATQSLPYSGAFPTMFNPQPISGSTHDRINLYLLAQP